MKTLNLHGYRHSEVPGIIDEFLALYDPPFKIITGNSSKMQQILFFELKKIGYLFYNESDHNLGSYIILKGNT